MSVRSSQSIIGDFTTRNAASGAATNADSLPTGTLVVNGTDNAASVTVTNKTTGVYKYSVTLPTLAIGDEVQMRIAATVATISDNAVVWSDTCDISIDSSGRLDVIRVNGASQTARDLGLALPAAAPGTVGGLWKLGANVGDITLTGNGLGHVAITIDGANFINANAGGATVQLFDSVGGNAILLGTSGSGVPILIDGSAGGHAVFLKSGTAKDIFHATIGAGGLFFNPTPTADLPSAPNGAAVTAIANGLLDLASAIDPAGGADTLRKAMRLVLASAVGKLSGAAGTSVAIRDTTDAKNRIVATVDADGNRTALTLDAS